MTELGKCGRGCGAQIVARGSVTDYPYSRFADVRRLDGLARLTAIEDREHAGNAFELFFFAEHNDTCPKFAAHERAKAADNAKEEFDRLKAYAEEAKNGAYGQAGQDAYNMIFAQSAWGRETRYDLQGLQAFEREMVSTKARRVDPQDRRRK
jgi:hypothetical protein